MKTLYLLPLYFISFSLVGQTWQEWEAARNLNTAFIEKIKGGIEWDSILNTTDTSLLSDYASDIQETIEFLKTPMANEVDSFFHDICSVSYTEFPFKIKDPLSDEFYTLHEENNAERSQVQGNRYRKNLYLKVSEIINIPSDTSIPLLIEYLDNHAATRLVVAPTWDMDDPSYYLSVSDMAMELIKIITWCEFYKTASSYDPLYSNLPSKDQAILTATIRNWYKNTHGLPKNEAAAFFLYSISPNGYSISYTCTNLLYYGDTLTALRTYQTYYEKMDMPCLIEEVVGKALLSLGDRRILEDCANKIMNYRCSENSGIKCVYLLLDWDYPYLDKIFGEVVSTEPHSLYRDKRTGFVWTTILAGIGNYEKRKMPVTLRALMQIDDDLETIGDLYAIPWKKKYGNQIREGFRVCDLALLKYDDTIQRIDIQDWSDKLERDNAILSILKETH